MKKVVLLAVSVIVGSSVVSLAAQPHKDVVDYGMARLYPITTPGIGDRYLADKIYGFPAGAAMLMASVGPISTQPAANASDFDHDFETATPYYYEADLQTSGIKAELTVAPESAYYRFTFPESAHSHLVFSMDANAQISVVGPQAIQGSQVAGGTVSTLATHTGETREYFYAEFSRPFSSWQSWQNGELSHAAQQSGNNIGFVTDSATTTGEVVEVRIGLSYISTEQAKKNLMREIPAWNFDQLKNSTRDLWNRTLGAVEVSGGSERQRTIFYTALYRSLCRMTDITEDGRYFSGYDHQVHNADGHDFYVDDGLWDTFRSEHPLQILLDARQQEDEAWSYIRMYQQSGWMPSFPSVAGEQAVMIGHHAAEFIADLYAKGIATSMWSRPMPAFAKMRQRQRCCHGAARRLPLSIASISIRDSSQLSLWARRKQYLRSRRSGVRRYR